MERLKAQLFAKNVGSGASPNIASQQASCTNSKARPDIVRKLDLQTNKNVVQDRTDEAIFEKSEEITEKCEVGQKCDQEVAEKNEVGEKFEEVGEKFVEKCEEHVTVQLCEEVVEVETCEDVVEVEKKFDEVELAIGSLSNIVAYATIDEVTAVEGQRQTLHGVEMAEENARVSITHSIQADVKIPFPIKDEILTVGQAVGTYIAWPRDLIVGGKISAPQMKCTPKVKVYLLILF